MRKKTKQKTRLIFSSKGNYYHGSVKTDELMPSCPKIQGGLCRCFRKLWLKDASHPASVTNIDNKTGGSSSSLLSY